MRDFLEEADRLAALEAAAADPINRARALNRPVLPARFYAQVDIAETERGFAVHLDGRPLKTPAKAPLLLPRRDIAERVAAEWQAQVAEIDPGTMPMTRLANSIVDGVALRHDAVVDDAARYAGSDLLCYRADGPERLVARQTERWDPVLDWIEERFGARFLVAEGIRHVAQDPQSIAVLRAHVAALDAWRLGGLHQMTTIGGSLFTALAVLDRHLTPAEGWEIVALDDLWQADVWGHDDEAAARLAQRRRDFDTAAMVSVSAG